MFLVLSIYYLKRALDETFLYLTFLLIDLR